LARRLFRLSTAVSRARAMQASREVARMSSGFGYVLAPLPLGHDVWSVHNTRHNAYASEWCCALLPRGACGASRPVSSCTSRGRYMEVLDREGRAIRVDSRRRASDQGQCALFGANPYAAWRAKCAAVCAAHCSWSGAVASCARGSVLTERGSRSSA
jgi:hypothetical protein